MTYKCNKCNKIFKLRHHLTYHMNKKISCEKVKDEQDNFKCLLCDKEYSFISGLIKHKKNHENYDEEVKKLDEKQKETDEINKLRELFITQDERMRLVIDKQQKEIELLSKEIEELKMNNTKNNTINNTTNNTTNNNTINNNTINNTTNNTTNIIIAFGSEEYESLSKSEIKKILFDHKIDPLLGMIEYIHFNDRLPQQQNIKFSNLRSKVIDVHNGDEWQMRDLDNVLDDLIENNIYNLDKIREMISEDYKPRIKEIVKTIIDDYYKHYKLDTEEKQDRDNKKLVEKMAKTKNDVKLHVYNKSRNKKNNNI